jgi:SAM-dependent methyltransferase
MIARENTAEVWDRIWAGESPTREGMSTMVLECQQSNTWSYCAEAVAEVLGGWDNVRCVEIGAGASTHSIVAALNGASATIMDYSAEALRVAKARCDCLGISATLVQADALALPSHLRGAFNLAWSFGTAEHFRGAQRIEFIRSHVEALKPGGLVVLTVPNKYAFNYRIWMGLSKLAGEWPFGLEIPFSIREVRRALGELGVESIVCLTDPARPCGHKVLGIVRRRWKAFSPLAKAIYQVLSWLPAALRSPLCQRNIVAIGRKA